MVTRRKVVTQREMNKQTKPMLEEEQGDECGRELRGSEAREMRGRSDRAFWVTVRMRASTWRRWEVLGTQLC